MSIRGHERWQDDLAAYLLGALEPDETEAMERHLDGCERCREELAWLRPGVEVLVDSVPRQEPPPQLRARLMEEVRADPALERRRRAAEPEGRRWRGFLLRPAVALGAVALVAAATAGYALRGDEEQDATTVAARQDGGIKATLEVKGDSGTLELQGMRQLPKARVYQAWVQHDDRIEPSLPFEVGPDGTAVAQISRDLEGADNVMVTVEPRGGSEVPGSQPVVSVALPD